MMCITLHSGSGFDLEVGWPQTVYRTVELADVKVVSTVSTGDCACDSRCEYCYYWWLSVWQPLLTEDDGQCDSATNSAQQSVDNCHLRPQYVVDTETGNIHQIDYHSYVQQ